MFERLGTWFHDRRRLTLGLWVAVLLLANGIAAGAGEAYRADFSLPGAESTAGFDILDEEFGGQGAGQVGTIVFQAEQGIDDPTVRASMQDLFAEVAQLDDVRRVESPYEPGNERLVAAQGDQVGRIAYANVEMPEDIDFAVAGEIRDAILDAAPDVEGLRIELGGFIFAEFEPPSPSSA